MPHTGFPTTCDSCHKNTDATWSARRAPSTTPRTSRSRAPTSRRPAPSATTRRTPQREQLRQRAHEPVLGLPPDRLQQRQDAGGPHRVELPDHLRLVPQVLRRDVDAGHVQPHDLPARRRARDDGVHGVPQPAVRPFREQLHDRPDDLLRVSREGLHGRHDPGAPHRLPDDVRQLPQEHRRHLVAEERLRPQRVLRAGGRARHGALLPVPQPAVRAQSRTTTSACPRARARRATRGTTTPPRRRWTTSRRASRPPATRATSSPTRPGCRATFSHTTFPLVGVHATTACTTCHNPPYAPSANNYTTVPTTCYGCHVRDFTGATTPVPHTGFPTTCDSCHKNTDATWSQKSAFVHNAYFALAGAHATAPCSQCHNPPYAPSANNYLSVPTSPCSACHLRDYNTATTPVNHIAAGFPTTCDTCHKFSDATWIAGDVQPHVVPDHQRPPQRPVRPVPHDAERLHGLQLHDLPHESRRPTPHHTGPNGLRVDVDGLLLLPPERASRLMRRRLAILAALARLGGPGGGAVRPRLGPRHRVRPGHAVEERRRDDDRLQRADRAPSRSTRRRADADGVEFSIDARGSRVPVRREPRLAADRLRRLGRRPHRGRPAWPCGSARCT